MRHRKSGKKLGRTWEHRKAMFKNMARSLIVYERIRTTVPKARELSKIMDKLITLAIRNDLSAKRQAYKIIENHKLVQRLFNEIGPKFSGGRGGYTRVVKFAAPRVGDSAAMAMIEFAYPEDKSAQLEPGKPETSAAAPVPPVQEEAPAQDSETEDSAAEEKAVSEDAAEEEAAAQKDEEAAIQDESEEEAPEAPDEEEKQDIEDEVSKTAPEEVSEEPEPEQQDQKAEPEQQDQEAEPEQQDQSAEPEKEQK